METAYGVYIHPEELDSTWIEEAHRSGVAVVGLHPVGGTDAAASFKALLELLKDDRFKGWLEELRWYGIRVETAAHALSWLLPRELFIQHPDWFRMDERGNRTPAYNLCPSNKAAMSYISRRAEQLVGLLPADGHRYHLWTDDAAVGMCCCPACRRFTAAEQSLMISNAILRGLRRRDAQAKLSFLAYHATMEVPTQVQPLPGLFLEYAPMDRDFHRPLISPDSDKNRQQTAPLAALLDFFGREEAAALDYWYDNSLQSGWKKPPVECRLEKEVLSADKALYRQLGFPYVNTFACYLGEDYRRLYGPGPDLSLLTEDQ